MLVKCDGKVIFRERINPMNIPLKKGVMEIVVLAMLQRKDFYGYELVTEISKYIEMSGNNAGGNNSPSAVNS